MILRDESKHRPIESSGFRRDERIRSDTALVNLAEVQLQTLLVSRLALRQSEETPLILLDRLLVMFESVEGSLFECLHVLSIKQDFYVKQFSFMSS